MLLAPRAVCRALQRPRKLAPRSLLKQAQLGAQLGAMRRGGAGAGAGTFPLEGHNVTTRQGCIPYGKQMLDSN